MKKDKLFNVSFRLRRSTLAGLEQVATIEAVTKSEFVRFHLEKAIKRTLKKGRVICKARCLRSEL